MNILIAAKDLKNNTVTPKEAFHSELNLEKSQIKTMSMLKKYGNHLK